MAVSFFRFCTAGRRGNERRGMLAQKTAFVKRNGLNPKEKIGTCPISRGGLQAAEQAASEGVAAADALAPDAFDAAGPVIGLGPAREVACRECHRHAHGEAEP